MFRDFMFRNKAFLRLSFLLPTILLVPFLSAQDEPVSHARIVRVTSVSGQVQISHQSGGTQNAIANLPIVQNDEVSTGDDGWLEIQLENGSRIRIAPDSRLTFSLLGRFAGGATTTEINIEDGEAAFAVAAGDDMGPFRINVRQRVISLKRSSRFHVTSIPSNPLEVVVWKGEVGVFDRESSREISVQTQETFTLDALDTGHYDLEKQAQLDELDDWANQRDQALIASADTHSDGLPALSYNNPVGVSPYTNGVGQVQTASGWNQFGNWDPFYSPYYSPYAPFSPFAYGFGPTYPWWGWPGFFPGGFFPPIIVVPNSGRPPVRGLRPPVPPSVAARAAGSPGVREAEAGVGGKATTGNPALTLSTDRENRTVISNEHPAVEPSNPVKAEGFEPGIVAGTPVTQSPRAVVGPPAPVASVVQRPVHVHPVVAAPTTAQSQPRAVAPGGAQPRVSAAPRISSTPAPRSFNSAPAMSAPSAHAGGGRR
jgi:FecR protein